MNRSVQVKIKRFEGDSFRNEDLPIEAIKTAHSGDTEAETELYGYIVATEKLDTMVYTDVKQAYDRAEYLNADDGVYRFVTRVRIV